MSEDKTEVPAGNEDEVKQQALTHLAQGKRHMLIRDYVEAVSSLSSACQLMAQLYGETANECGDAYFNYGKALLALARVENGVLGIVDGEVENEVSSGDDDDNDEDNKKEEDDEKDEEKEKAELNENKADGNEKVEEGNEKVEEGNEKVEEGNGKVEEGNEKVEEGNEKVEEGNEKVEKDSIENGEAKKEDGNTVDGEESAETIDDLKEAWEILDLAKMIFERQSGEDAKLRMADIHLALGEVCLESENFAQAVEEIKHCLDIQLEHLKPDDRAIAESLYQLGLAKSLYGDYDEAAEQFRKAAELLLSRVANLKLRSAEKKPPAESEVNPFYTIEGEIVEIEALIPEVEEKIADMRDYKEQAMKTLLEQVKGSNGTSKDGASTSSAEQPKPVSDISHLVRKKRKPDDAGDVGESTAAKQVCTEKAITR